MKVDFHGVDVRLIIYALSGVDGLMVIKEGVLRVAHMHFHGQRGCAFLRAEPVWNIAPNYKLYFILGTKFIFENYPKVLIGWILRFKVFRYMYQEKNI